MATHSLSVHVKRPKKPKPDVGKGWQLWWWQHQMTQQWARAGSQSALFMSGLPARAQHWRILFSLQSSLWKCPPRPSWRNISAYSDPSGWPSRSAIILSMDRKLFWIQKLPPLCFCLFLSYFIILPDKLSKCHSCGLHLFAESSKKQNYNVYIWKSGLL